MSIVITNIDIENIFQLTEHGLKNGVTTKHVTSRVVVDVGGSTSCVTTQYLGMPETHAQEVKLPVMVTHKSKFRVLNAIPKIAPEV